MQYTVLARKYRPQQFDDLVGQEHISRTLKNAIAQKRVAHAYLFVGPRGIGKTSTARILAKALVCEEGPTETPCGVCSSCREVAAGTNLDVLEIDGASNRGIDEVRAIRDNVRYSPARAPFKIYIIDEVHQITRDAFNALLKTLEEPPSHVKFFFATTEAHKVPTTILSRCQRFDLRRIPTALITERLKEIAATEKVSAEPRALGAIARAADGGMRDALSSLDQLIAFCGESIREEDVLAAHGLASRGQLLELARATLAASLEDAFGVIKENYHAGRDLHRILQDMVSLFRDLVVVKAADNPGALVDLSSEEMGQLEPLIAPVSLDRLVRILDLFSSAEGRLRQVVSHRALLEMTVIKAAQLATRPSIDDVLSLIQKMRERGPDFNLGGSGAPVALDRPKAVSPVVVPESTLRSRPEEAPASVSVSASAVEPATEEADSAADVRDEEVVTPAVAPAPAAAVRPAAPTGSTIPLSETKEIWEALLRRVEGSFVLRSILFSGRPVGLISDGSWVIEFPEGSESLQEIRNKPDYLLLVARFLERFSGTKTVVVARTKPGDGGEKVPGPVVDGPGPKGAGTGSDDDPAPAAPDAGPEVVMDLEVAELGEEIPEGPAAVGWEESAGDLGGMEEEAGDRGEDVEAAEGKLEGAALDPPVKAPWAARAARAMRGRGGEDASQELGAAFERMSRMVDGQSEGAGASSRRPEEGRGAAEQLGAEVADGQEEGRRRFRAGLKKFEGDPHVRIAMELFEGRLVEIQR